MYYLDFYQLHRPTTKQERVLARGFDRDFEMARKLKLQRNACFYCAVEISMADHLDHVLPVYYGGKSNKANLVASCRDCNLTKGTGQIEITNMYTIKNYLWRIEAKKKWDAKIKEKPWLKRYMPKKVLMYHIYHAELFKKV